MSRIETGEREPGGIARVASRHAGGRAGRGVVRVSVHPPAGVRAGGFFVSVVLTVCLRTGTNQAIPRIRGSPFSMVGEAGIEPARACAQRILSPSCLPISPLARMAPPAPIESRYVPASRGCARTITQSRHRRTCGRLLIPGPGPRRKARRHHSAPTPPSPAIYDFPSIRQIDARYAVRFPDSAHASPNCYFC